MGSNASGTLTVRWPNGVQENLGSFSANQAIHLVEPQPPEPDISVDPTSLAFGSVDIGTTSDLAVTVTNDGTQQLTLTALGTTNSTFTVLSPSTPAVVAANGGTQDVTVRFSPVAGGC